jgi:hypothetical protein
MSYYTELTAYRVWQALHSMLRLCLSTVEFHPRDYVAKPWQHHLTLHCTTFFRLEVSASSPSFQAASSLRSAGNLHGSLYLTQNLTLELISARSHMASVVLRLGTSSASKYNPSQRPAFLCSTQSGGCSQGLEIQGPPKRSLD